MILKHRTNLVPFPNLAYTGSYWLWPICCIGRGQYDSTVVNYVVLHKLTLPYAHNNRHGRLINLQNIAKGVVDLKPPIFKKGCKVLQIKTDTPDSNVLHLQI